MAIMAVLQQKGGVTKSTLARAIGVEGARAGLDVHLADLNPQQQTTYLWAVARDQAGHSPRVDATVYHRTDKLLREADGRQLVVVDGGPHASSQSLEIARAAKVVVIPTGVTTDDLREALKLGQEFVAAGVPRQKLIYVLSRTPSSDREIESARTNIEAFGFVCASGHIPLSTGYGAAMDSALAITETRFRGLNDKAMQVIQQIFDHASSS
ncbi:TPA: ParA family protein [Pseudomonas aeruginosa]|uniref:ParA family protein n=1 Tax=Pseudomonas aeruginosa TaxID=287 RepID=UPI000941A036|nr:ParA family protein [Pseudomonas aeruginosa]OKS40412.1 DNA-binding protein [Pseudomonas aeruginosa]HBO7934619.1 ParA family protein [Pseudomonas aeruginosa]HBO8188561.1 ParA family protein [Pseudomonas aeruginosa]HBO8713810.1 ParA family protein [Pseudomonas aeruginosa]